VLEFSRHFGATAVLHSRNIRGNLRNAALRAGIPAVTFELGEPGSMQEEHIKYGIKAIETLLDKLGMLKRRSYWKEAQPVFYGSRWVRVNNGGLLRSNVKVGAKVRQGALLGTIVNPLTSDIYRILSPYTGRVLGMALNQYMLPGYAAYHIGIAGDETEMVMEPPLDCEDWENPMVLAFEDPDCASDTYEDDGPEYLDEPVDDQTGATADEEDYL
jgi:predicted deacylase